MQMSFLEFYFLSIVQLSISELNKKIEFIGTDFNVEEYVINELNGVEYEDFERNVVQYNEVE